MNTELNRLQPTTIKPEFIRPERDPYPESLIKWMNQLEAYLLAFNPQYNVNSEYFDKSTKLVTVDMLPDITNKELDNIFANVKQFVKKYKFKIHESLIHYMISVLLEYKTTETLNLGYKPKAGKILGELNDELKNRAEKGLPEGFIDPNGNLTAIDED